jgi:predicted Rossmann fold nucleotide-binding protein DprA/Smf involved in DNA uptake
MQYWEMTYQELALSGLGNQALMSMPKAAFFASRQCPGSAISAALDWAVQQAKAKQTVISGFHSPLEQSVLKILIAAHSPAVVVLARPLQSAQLPREWTEPLAQGHLTIVSQVLTKSRLTKPLAMERNALAAQMAETIVVAHASTGGSLASQVSLWRLSEHQIDILSVS